MYNIQYKITNQSKVTKNQEKKNKETSAFKLLILKVLYT